MKRTLSLKREALIELTTEEMAAFAGASPPDPTPPVFLPHTLNPRECLATTQDSVIFCSGNCVTYNCA